MVRMEEIAEASLADILERSKLGIAIAINTRMIATTISNSMSENPPWRALVQHGSNRRFRRTQLWSMSGAIFLIKQDNHSRDSAGCGKTASTRWDMYLQR
jgi:hypothetical protein